MGNCTYHLSFCLFWLAGTLPLATGLPTSQSKKPGPIAKHEIRDHKPWTLESVVGRVDRLGKYSDRKKNRSGYDWNGIQEDTSSYNPTSYDVWGYHKEGYNKWGRPRDGSFPADEMASIYVRHMIPEKKEIPMELERLVEVFLIGKGAITKKGFHKKLRFNIFTLSEYDRQGYNRDGFDKTGTHKETGTKYNKEGFEKGGTHKDTGTKYNKEGFDKNHLHKNTGTYYNEKGFDKAGIHKETGVSYDREGYDRYGVHIYEAYREDAYYPC